MKILCIGNSFSQDATRYLHQIARADGVKLDVYNLYIGGCSLERHYRNMLSEAPAYELDVNGTVTPFFVSIKQALLAHNWDYISVQQASALSVDFETYEPYLSALCQYIREFCPKAKLILHQTWAYANDSTRLMYESHAAMFKKVSAAYKEAENVIKPSLVIRSGETIAAMVDAKIDSIYRDGYHGSFGAGRYAMGLTWYRALTGADISENTFSDLDEEVSADTICKIKSIVMHL